MSLIAFHRLLIAAAIIFCAGFAVWEGFAFANGGGWVELGVAVAFTAAAGGFGYYLRHLSRFLHLPAAAQRSSGRKGD